MQQKIEKVPKMLTIKQTTEVTGLSSYTIRQLVLRKNKNVKFIKTGKKYLINLDSLIDFLNIGENEPKIEDLSKQLKKVEV